MNGTEPQGGEFLAAIAEGGQREASVHDAMPCREASDRLACQLETQVP